MQRATVKDREGRVIEGGAAWKDTLGKRKTPVAF